METIVLEERINGAINHLIPLFHVREKELGRVKEIKIKRILEFWEHPEHPREVPAYNFVENYFYFPQKDEPQLDIFSQHTVYHEAGHHIHCLINPYAQRWISSFLKKGEWPSKLGMLKETIATYANFVSGFIPEEKFFGNLEKDVRKIYSKYGPEFLHSIVRMGITEAKDKGII